MYCVDGSFGSRRSVDVGRRALRLTPLVRDLYDGKYALQRLADRRQPL